MLRFCGLYRNAALLGIALTATSACLAANKLTISPNSPRQLNNSTLQFTASINGELIDGPVTWTSSNPPVATIAGANGIANASLLGAGTTTITAVHGGQSASTVLTVTVAVAPVFTAQPTDTNVSAVIDPMGGVKVQLLDNLGDPLPGQNLTMSIGTNPPSLATPSLGAGVLSGTFTQTTDAAGTATFSDLKIDWLGNGYTLIATANPSSGTVAGASAAFNELRVGDICLGPDTPACQGSCPDADGDGLNDAWEIAGGIDLNGDGKIDAQHDLLLPGADPNRPDIYVHYDWMGYGDLETACTTALDCPNSGILGSPPVVCTGPPIPGNTKSCKISCQTTSDCTSLGDPHLSDVCTGSLGAMTCKHTHDPEALVPRALQAVVDRFAAHGINLHLERGQTLPHSHVLSFRLLSDPANPGNSISDGCEGGSVVSGTAGVGKYAESIFDLKANYFDPKKHSAYHYMIFSHYSGCDTSEHCTFSERPDQCLIPPVFLPLNVSLPVVGQTGYSEINGNNFIVSLGNFFNDGEALLGFAPPISAPGGAPLGQFSMGGTFMHELGHNLGLHHGGGVSLTNSPDFCVGGPSSCDELNWKPNYLSVMNYLWQANGIERASAPGEFIPVGTRLDYSTQVLPTVPVSDGVLGVLDEFSLDETVPFGLTSGNSDLFSFTDGTCVRRFWPTHAAVDWDGNGIIGDNSHAVAELDPNSDPLAVGSLGCPAPNGDKLYGHVDWGPGPGQSIFRYGFQCTQFFTYPPDAGGGGSAGTTSHTTSGGSATGSATAAVPLSAKALFGSISNNQAETPSPELSAYVARRAHVLYPTAVAKIVIRPGCRSAAKPIAPGERGPLTVVLLGAEHLDVNNVDISSLHFHGATPQGTTVMDVDGDGKPDLLIAFDMRDVKLDAKANSARLTGWLKNSQSFVGEDKIRVVPSVAGEDPACRK
jgi:hypothetical protein